MSNKESYLASATVDYYKELSSGGLFAYEEAIINRFFVPGQRILDVGCGAGRTTVALKRMGFDVRGIDYSVNMILAAKKVSDDIYYDVQDARDLRFRDCSFDCAIFSFNGLMLLETYEDRKKAMLEIKRVLKEGGIFFFTTPFLDNKVTKDYWKEKIQKYGKDLESFSDAEKLSLGDETTDEDGIEFRLHVPFIVEIARMCESCGFDVSFSARRLNAFPEEKLEEELDDNYIWVVKKKYVLV